MVAFDTGGGVAGRVVGLNVQLAEVQCCAG